jgi:hypothetical protein
MGTFCITCEGLFYNADAGLWGLRDFGQGVSIRISPLTPIMLSLNPGDPISKRRWGKSVGG